MDVLRELHGSLMKRALVSGIELLELLPPFVDVARDEYDLLVVLRGIPHRVIEEHLGAPSKDGVEEPALHRRLSQARYAGEL